MRFWRAKELGRQFGLTLTILFIVLVLVGCQSADRLPMVSVKPTDHSLTNPKPMENQNVLRVGISSVLSPRETLDNYQDLADYLQRKIGRPVQLIQRQSYQEINDLVRDQGVDVAFICSGAYVTREQENLELLAVPEVNGKSTYQSYVIVSSNSKFQSFQDLKGQVFGFTDPISFSGTIAPTYMVTLLNSQPTEFFKRIVYTYSHDNSIKAVLDNVVSAAGVDSLVYQYSVAKDPSLAAKVRIIAQSPEVGSPPVVVNKSIDSHLKAALLEALLQMDNDPIGKKALQALLYDRFVLPNNAAYEPIQTMVKANAALKDKK
ncbi:phosphate/phosphite/phosphonate ABC transporter substrate-binding protein [Desulfosporosinus metallidurans]|uniref:Phosphonate ABC transporter phosphate-binding periplasmic component n=1 Tax=Desulfosporosinus metallidurans TaxID=1888891 RepID=A0A1Q8R0P1_9FIRM|nr:phosphate/phosphite/phosphonate ABC transporter substrate-binding protein [Desulfosporosinus metallidurans]OLN33164.1 Phosphonate ABC transporter phosphate-binding periplasmic component [Desulfosporosinus metallidurans]